MPGRDVEGSSKVIGSGVQGQRRRAPKANVGLRKSIDRLSDGEISCQTLTQNYFKLR